jgi:hypothetical protein
VDGVPASRRVRRKSVILIYAGSGGSFTIHAGSREVSSTGPFWGINMRKLLPDLVVTAAMSMSMAIQPANATGTVSPCPGSLVVGSPDVFTVTSTECSLTFTAGAAGDFLEVSTAPPAGNPFDFQVNSGSTLNLSDPDPALHDELCSVFWSGNVDDRSV